MTVKETKGLFNLALHLKSLRKNPISINGLPLPNEFLVSLTFSRFEAKDFTKNPGPIGQFSGIVDMKFNRLDRQIRDDPEAFAYLGIQIDERFVWESGEFRSGVGGVVGGRKALFTVNKGTFF